VDVAMARATVDRAEASVVKVAAVGAARAAARGRSTTNGVEPGRCLATEPAWRVG
jgi:hypothetical protein